MDLPGINSILKQPASAVWPSEQEADPELVRMFEATYRAMEYHRHEEAAELLGQIARYQLQPSQEMRLQYLHGELFTALHDYPQAYRFYDMALDIATEGGDVDSMILLSMLAGLLLYGDLRNSDAVAYYQHALELWRARSIQPLPPRLDPEVMILTYLGQPQWSMGALDDAHATLGRALALAWFRHGAPRDEYLRRNSATALWTLALVLRSQSDMCDGDASLIRTAIRRAHTALGLYKSIGELDKNLARFNIQIAELYLDLAELHLLRGARPAAQAMRHEALNHVRVAQDNLQPTDDTAAKLLARLTLARHAITWPLNRTAARALRKTEATVTQIEREAAAINDRFVSAKAATLRGEWLLWLGDTKTARESLQLALDGFAGDGMGMATRAQRLLRRIPPSPDPGGQRRPSDGPLPEPLIPPNLNNDDLN